MGEGRAPEARYMLAQRVSAGYEAKRMQSRGAATPLRVGVEPRVGSL